MSAPVGNGDHGDQKEQVNDSKLSLSSSQVGQESESAIPKIRQDVLKWNGWGYKDSGFVHRDGMLQFTGSRYQIGSLALPYFTQWVVENLGADFSKKYEPIVEPTPEQYPESLISSDFIVELECTGVSHSVRGDDRLFRSHGHTLHEIFYLRKGKFPRIPDIVVWPEKHDDVVILVNIASKHQVVIIPYGGGTSVSGGLCCPEYEKRPIMSVDTSQMKRILWIDEANLLCCAESGIIGQDIEAQLKLKGFTTGHEPDSYEFSSLGGWVATRASGMKKNSYGNIEDLLVHAKLVTPTGVLEKFCQVPRLSAGTDIHHFILGSEGILGIVTEVVLKIRPIPSCKKYGSIVFSNFAAGVATLHEIAKQRCQPSSIRLMDNEQFKFGHSLRPAAGFMGSVKESAKALFLTKFKGFDMNQICVTTLLFEGREDQVESQEQKIYAIASKYGGIPAGHSSGERGYILTFVIAYIRDIGLDYGIVAESFETSVPWSNTYNLCENVKLRVTNECKSRGISHFFITCRVTQTYDVGSCVYFYFAFNYYGMSDPVRVFEEIETLARNEIIANRGSISHHHGVGKIRKQWLPKTISSCGIETIRQIKRVLDPQNIFASGNVIGEDVGVESLVLQSKL